MPIHSVLFGTGAQLVRTLVSRSTCNSGISAGVQILCSLFACSWLLSFLIRDELDDEAGENAQMSSDGIFRGVDRLE